VISTYDQIYLLGKQVRRESLVYGKVDYIVTDSPVMIAAYYAQKYCPQLIAEGVTDSAVSFYKQAADDGHRHVHVYLQRSKGYNPSGRYQTEEQAKVIDGELRTFLEKQGFPLIDCGTDLGELFELLRTTVGVVNKSE
jgi:hypothetical protein